MSSRKATYIAAVYFAAAARIAAFGSDQFVSMMATDPDKAVQWAESKAASALNAAKVAFQALDPELDYDVFATMNTNVALKMGTPSVVGQINFLFWAKAQERKII